MILSVSYVMSFNPLPSHEGRRYAGLCSLAFRNLSIHFPLTREDGIEGTMPNRGNFFQSTSLSRGKTDHPIQQDIMQVFQSTSLSRGKTIARSIERCFWDLSIHFPLTREDYLLSGRNVCNLLSIHFPLTREDLSTINSSILECLSIHFPLTREDSKKR